MTTRIMSLIVVSITWFVVTQSLIVRHDFKAGMAPFSYQTFSGVAMYSANDVNTISHYTPIHVGNGESYIDFDLVLERNIAERSVFVELIVIPDVNIYDIGFKQHGNLHLCCNIEVFGKYGCDENHLGELIIPKKLKGLHRQKMQFNSNASYHLKTRVPISVSSIYVFALATCDSNLQSDYPGTYITFKGSSMWMNSYGSLSGDMYPYLVFYGWTSVVYSILFCLWNIVHVNKCYSHTLFVSISVSLVLLLSLIYTLFWYNRLFDMNVKDYIKTSYEYNIYDIFGLVVSSTRGIITIVVFMALCCGYGLFKSLKSLSRMKRIIVIILVIVYWIILFCNVQIYAIAINDLDLNTHMMASAGETLIAAIISIIILFGLLQSTIKQLRLKNISVKQKTNGIVFYESIIRLLVISLLIIIVFSSYKMYIGLNELAVTQWNKIWVFNCWTEILFLFSIIAIMIMLRPSNNSWFSSQLGNQMKHLINTNQEIQLNQTNTININESDDFEGRKA